MDMNDYLENLRLLDVAYGTTKNPIIIDDNLGYSSDEQFPDPAEEHPKDKHETPINQSLRGNTDNFILLT